MSTDAGLTIVIPTKDRPDFLRAAVASALAALPPDGEVVVVDDRGRVPAADALAALADPRLRVVVSNRTPGPSGARNCGVAAASGATVLFLDDDDLMRPGYPGWVATFRAAHPAVSYGFSAIERFAGPPPDPVAPYAAAGFALLDDAPFRRRLAGLGCGFWIDRGAFVRTGGIAEDIRVNEDTEFAVRLLSAGMRGVRATAPGVLVRDHAATPASGNAGHLTHRSTAAERAGYFGAILDRHADWLQGQPAIRHHLLQRRLKLLARAGDRATAAQVLASPAAAEWRIPLRLYFAACRLGDRLRGR
ncbi:glycosyltransferase [Ruixingdingia sedimenti]|uniref:Glycosyltransferase n=1 Tax=Ruixingdingia sedimenti TaxID=3073604 RepID=A0ABU1F428_9RHOB|nr:glycosyltransferase [Xinfangfangia sp. LG-4]MDR5651584.1 glycosyltransferase [Xinfangfangia sp. LG-4]